MQRLCVPLLAVLIKISITCTGPASCAFARHYLFFSLFVLCRTTEIPETPRNCELHNDTVLEVVCQAGSDGGLSQSFLLEVVGGTPPPMFNLDYTRSPPTEIDNNEISTMNDQVSYVSHFLLPLPSPKLRANPGPCPCRISTRVC